MGAYVPIRITGPDTNTLIRMPLMSFTEGAFTWHVVQARKQVLSWTEEKISKHIKLTRNKKQHAFVFFVIVYLITIFYHTLLYFVNFKNINLSDSH